MTPDEYCQEKTGGSGSSFYYSFLFLPPDKRRGITALYAFCREVDDTVDECSDVTLAQAKLAWWQEEIHRTFQNKPSHPVSQALLPAIQSWQLPEVHFREIIHGVSMDLERVRFAAFADLEHYCYHVASAVGLLSATIFGANDAKTLDFARNLGMALQLTNIIRDVGEDARRNRLYLPAEDLAKFQVPAMDILQGRYSPQFNELMTFQAHRAYDYYQKALADLPDKDRKLQLPSLIMAAIYKKTLDEIVADGYRVLDHKISLTPLRKLWIAWKVYRQEKSQHKKRKPVP